MKEVKNTCSCHEIIELPESYHGLHHISLRTYRSMREFSSNLVSDHITYPAKGV